MLKIDNRESAHLRSRVKDLSQVPNIVNFTGLFAAITPIKSTTVADKRSGEGDDTTYEPILIRDVDSLISIFGDPRIDPEKYVDLYCIMQIIKNGGTAYVAKVYSGETGSYDVYVTESPAHFYNSDEALGNGTFTLKQVGTTSKWETGDLSATQSVKNKYILNSLTVTTASMPTASLPDGKGGGFIFTSLTHDCPYSKVEIAGNSTGVLITLIPSSGGDTTILVEGTGTIESSSLPPNITDVFSVSDYSQDSPGYSISGRTEQTQIKSTEASSTINSDQFTYKFDALDSYDYHLLVEITDTSITNVTGVLIQSTDRTIDTDWRDNYALSTTDYNLEFLTSGSGFVFETNGLKSNKLIVRAVYQNTTQLVDPSNYTAEYVSSGDTDKPYRLRLTFKTEVTNPKIKTVALAEEPVILAESSMSEPLTIETKMYKVKPYSLNAYYYSVTVKSEQGMQLCSAKVKLDENLTNNSFINVINSSLRPYLRYTIPSGTNNESIANILRNTYSSILDTLASNNKSPEISLPPVVSKTSSTDCLFTVKLKNYVNALNQYKDRRYAGRIMADLTAPINCNDDGESLKDGKLVYLSTSDRRVLHYHMKEIACERKDTIAILSTPYVNYSDYDKIGEYDGSTLDNEATCDWVTSNGSYANLWEYGNTDTTEYAFQSFYLEIYHSWLKMKCDAFVNGVLYLQNTSVTVAPSGIVVNNILKSWRERGVQYPVAGDQFGVLPDYCSVINNPKLKSERDMLVQSRINPIYDTGVRGVQIYGNETLNAGYTDLNAAHIARTFVYLRSAIDEYTETLKFSINSQVLWDTWKTYVTSRILEPLRTANGISEYQVLMGSDTTSREEIANRQINGIVRVIFYQSAEIFDLTYTVYSSSTTIEEALANS